MTAGFVIIFIKMIKVAGNGESCRRRARVLNSVCAIVVIGAQRLSPGTVSSDEAHQMYLETKPSQFRLSIFALLACRLQRLREDSPRMHPVYISDKRGVNVISQQLLDERGRQARISAR